MAKTSGQVHKNKLVAPNPTGKGGFGERPQDINRNGTWKPENSQGYCLRFFLAMTDEEFTEWPKKNPKEKRTVAQILAYERVTKARKELADYREVTDRTEGKAPQNFNFEGDINHSITHAEALALLSTKSEKE